MESDAVVSVSDDEPFSLEDVYQEGVDVPQNPVDPVYIEQEKRWEKLEFGDPAVSDEVRAALASITIQLHYISLAQLTLLGNIIAENSQMRAKRLAALLASSRVRNVDAWGRYLEKLDEGGNVRPQVENYFQRLYTDDQAISRLISIILLDVLNRTMYDNLNGLDTTFERVLHRNITQAEKNIDLALHYLQYWDRKLSRDEKRSLAGHIRYYITLIEECVDACSDDLDTINVDSEQVLAQFDGNARDFYHEINPQN